VGAGSVSLIANQGSVLMFLEGARAEEGETQVKTSALRVMITLCPRHRQPGGVPTAWLTEHEDEGCPASDVLMP
jgi:hypothetical protein